MGQAIVRRRYALICALSLLLCLPLVKPWLDMGTIDDVSYTRSAQLLAQTGHIVYNGWAAPILGWHLYWGALFIKIFGFSFNVTRLSTLPIAMLSAFLSQRSMVRSGLTEWNATLATLTLVLSPLFLPLSFSYMTDIGGYLVLVLCFYACLRTLEAETEAQACCWIAFAAISNSIGGTIRQIGWLGLLVIIPSTLWILRGRRRVLLCGLISMVFGLAIMVGAMEWYKHQPGILPEPIFRRPLTRNKLRSMLRYMARILFDAPLFLLPVLLLFVPKVQWKNREVRITFLCVGLLVVAALLFIQPSPTAWLEPPIGNYVTEHGVVDGNFIKGSRPVVLTENIRFFLTTLVLAGLAAIAAVLMWPPAADHHESEGPLAWKTLFQLTGPFLAAYLILMTSRASVEMVFDRYLVPILFLLLLALTRYYQERISLRLPRYAFGLLAIVAIYSVSVTHDMFAMLRARLNAARELEARNVPASEIDGGWEFNSWTVLMRTPMLRTDNGATAATRQQNDPNVDCEPEFSEYVPIGRPEFALSYDPNACGGPVGVPAVHYREWLGPRDVSIYVISTQRQQPKMT